MRSNTQNSLGDTYKSDMFTKHLRRPKYVNTKDPKRLIKQGIWLYFILLIIEGALRKWLLPELATPLLVVRDPIALLLLIIAWQRALVPSNVYLVASMTIGIIGIFTAIFLGHGSIPVALFGARPLLLHFPLIFVIGSVFDQEDVIKMGKVTLSIAIPMTILIALQFYSPQSAWVNRGVGGDIAGAGFSGAKGYFRPSGMFSFTIGLTSFYSFVAPFIFYFWFNSNRINWLLLVSATFGLLASIPLSISRSLFFSIGITLIFSIIAVSRKPKYLTKIIGAFVGVILAMIILSQASFFQTASEAFLSRFEIANKAEGGVESVLLDRYLGGIFGALTGNYEVPFFGYGLGMGTNVGSMLLSGRIKFLVSEGEWGRLIGELGFLMGLTTIFIRLIFSINLAIDSYKRLVKGDLLPWLLLSYALLIIPQGQWSQPTFLGFSAIVGGLILASLDYNKKIKIKK